MANKRLLEFVEHLIADNTKEAEKLFHQYIVETSANYRRSLLEMDEINGEEDGVAEFAEEHGDELRAVYDGTGGEDVNGTFDDFVAMQYGKSIRGEEDAIISLSDELDMDSSENDDFIGTDESEEEESEEDRLDDLEEMIEKLQAEFDELMANDGDESEEDEADVPDDDEDDDDDEDEDDDEDLAKPVSESVKRTIRKQILKENTKAPTKKRIATARK